MNQPAQTVEQIQTRCCIVGGGPAGMMLGFLLARAGVEVRACAPSEKLAVPWRRDN
jgi:2-polyprenyl-6-methoxyphenol hydroxylase-like FAD-dependent oxidoreductase